MRLLVESCVLSGSTGARLLEARRSSQLSRNDVSKEVQAAMRTVHGDCMIASRAPLREFLARVGAPPIEPFQRLPLLAFGESPEHGARVREDDADEHVGRISAVPSSRLLGHGRDLASSISGFPWNADSSPHTDPGLGLHCRPPYAPISLSGRLIVGRVRTMRSLGRGEDLVSEPQDAGDSPSRPYPRQPPPCVLEGGSAPEFLACEARSPDRRPASGECTLHRRLVCRSRQ